MSETENTPNGTVEVYKRHNVLKDKLGVRIQTNEDGHIDQKLIDEADDIIAEMCKGCEETIGEQISIMSALWKEMIEAGETALRKEKAKEIFTVAHEIKDISSLCGYMLIADFAESLRDYIAETALSLKNQKIIIQAHIDAITTVHRAKIKDDTNPIAEELKKMVKIAIKKYH